MKGILIGILALLVLSLTGCAELKELRVETSEQKALIDRLHEDNQACTDSLEATREQLRQAGLELQAKEEKVREQSEAFTRMQQAMKAELESKQVALKELEGKLTLTMVEAILFDSGKAEVKQEGRDALQKVADVLKTVEGQEIVVAGYTDNVQIGERLAKIYPSNWELSAARAISVVKILVSDGVSPENISAAGYGEYRPVADNDTPEGRAQNRRMEIILMPVRK
ncbi:MAG TPA: OmpA family protein [Deltaproteobacteria bacterium]|nr:OmpA family protein [Deltaproteobacteria bacterium]